MSGNEDFDSTNSSLSSKKKQINSKKKMFAIAAFPITLFCLYFLLSRWGYVVPPEYFFDVFCLSNCADNLSSVSLHTNLPRDNLLNSSKQIEQIITNKDKTSILIEKSKYKLTIYYNKQPIKSYPVVFGFNPVADKFKEGDGSTPEGIFQIKEFYPHSHWSKFLWLDYPNKASWRKNLQAKLQGKISWLDSIGGQVGIHGVPTGEDNLIEKRSNWTLGCISLKNADVDELYKFVQKGTQVEIIQ